MDNRIGTNDEHQAGFSGPKRKAYGNPPVPSPPPVTPGSGDAAGLRVAPECVICETQMDSTAPDHWMCRECRSECYVPGGSRRIVSPGIGESDQADLPGMQAKDGGRRT